MATAKNTVSTLINSQPLVGRLKPSLAATGWWKIRTGRDYDHLDSTMINAFHVAIEHQQNYCIECISAIYIYIFTYRGIYIYICRLTVPLSQVTDHTSIPFAGFEFFFLDPMMAIDPSLPTHLIYQIRDNQSRRDLEPTQPWAVESCLKKWAK